MERASPLDDVIKDIIAARASAPPNRRGRPPMRRDAGRHRERRNALIGSFVRRIMETRGLKPRPACELVAHLVVGLSRIVDPDFAIERGLGAKNRRTIAIGRSRAMKAEHHEKTAEQELAEFYRECFRQDQKRREHISSLLDDF